MAKNFWDLLTSILIGFIVVGLLCIVVLTSWEVSKEAKFTGGLSLFVGFSIFVATWVTKRRREELDKKADKSVLESHIREDNERYNNNQKSEHDKYEEVKAVLDQSMGIVKDNREIVVRIEHWIMTGEIVKKSHKIKED
jgi:ABC-type transport system involved in Fe-S cluster assembly fused permease/ATPase subunit